MMYVRDSCIKLYTYSMGHVKCYTLLPQKVLLIEVNFLKISLKFNNALYMRKE